MINPIEKGSFILLETLWSERDIIANVLYSKDYILIPIVSYLNNEKKSYILASNTIKNEYSLKEDVMFIKGRYSIKNIFIHYNNNKCVKIEDDGYELECQKKIYESPSNHPIHIYNGVSFSFIPCRKYIVPKDIKDFKNGMIVEFYNNGAWKEKTVLDANTEYEKMYKLLIKYNKLRIPA